MMTGRPEKELIPMDGIRLTKDEGVMLMLFREFDSTFQHDLIGRLANMAMERRLANGETLPPEEPDGHPRGQGLRLVK